MPYNQSTVSTVTNDLYKLIVSTISSAYRKSTPLLAELTAPNRKGANPEGTVGFFDRFQNNYMYLDVIDQPIFATATGTSNKMVGGKSNITQFSAQCKPIYNSVQYENFAEDITSNDKGAVKRLSNILIEQMTRGFKRSLNRMLWGANDASAGFSGVPSGYTFSSLALTGSSGSGTSSISVTLDTDRNGCMYFTVGMPIRVQGATGGTSLSGFPDYTTVTGINTSTQTITIADSLTFGASKPIVACSPDGSFVNEIQGVPQLVVNTGTVQGVNITTLNQSLSHIINPGSGSFSATYMQQGRLACQIAKPDEYFCNQNVYKEMGLAAVPQERTGMGKNANLDLGFDSFTTHQGTVEVFLDYDCPAGNLFGLYTPGFTLGILKDVHMLPLNMMRLPQYPVYEVAMAWEGNLAQAVFDANFIYQAIT